MKKTVFTILIAVAGSLVSAAREIPVPEGDNPVVIGNKRITLISPTLVRLEYAQDKKFLDAPTMFASCRDSLLNPARFSVKAWDDSVEIATDRMRIVMLNDNFPFGQGNTKFYFMKGGKERFCTARNLHSKTQNLNLGGSIPTLDGVSNEIPLHDGLLSSDGWFFLSDTGTETIGPDGWWNLRPREHVQDQYCFVYGDDFHAPFADLARIAGRVPMTRKYMHGIWYSRWYPYDDRYIRELVGGFNANGFPLDILSMDMDWHTIDDATVGSGHNNTRLGWTGHSWNRKLISDPAATIASLHADSIYVCVNEHPHDGIRPHEDCYAPFMKAMGLDPASGESLIFDAGDKRYMEQYIRHSREENHRYGVDFWWLDWQQDYLAPWVRGSHIRHVPWLNRLYYADTERDGRRGAGYSRWGGWGDHRYPINFSGDARSNWEMLAFEVKLSQTSGNQGCYYWAHDIGGFSGETRPELLARWSQFGAVSAALRTHAHRGANADRRPWIWGEKATRSMRNSYSLRAELMPYIYSAVRLTHETMLPLNRCMFVDYPLDSCAYNRYGQYLFGDLMLAAPIVKPGEGEDFTASKEVWFPTDTDWFDFFTDERHKAGTIAIVTKNLDTFPLFVRGGSLLPMQPFTRRPGTSQVSSLRLRAYPGKDGDCRSFDLYEDDGISRRYLDGEFAKTRLEYRQQGRNVKLTVHPAEGSFEGQLQKRSYTFELGAFGKLSDVRIDGRKASVVQKDGRPTIYVPERSIRKPVVLSFKTMETPAPKLAANRRHALGTTIAPLGGLKGLNYPNLHKLRESGIEVIEISLTGIVNGPDSIPLADLPARFAAVREAADSAGIRIWSIHMPYSMPGGETADPSETDERLRLAHENRYRRLIKCVEPLGPSYILFHPSGSYLPEGERPARMKACVRTISNLRADAKAIGASIIVENLRGPRLSRGKGLERGLGRTVEEMTELMRIMPDDVYAVVDLNHIEHPEQLLRTLGSRVKSLHVCDSDGERDRHWLPGRGHNDWTQILAALNEIGYDGPWLYELKKDQVKNYSDLKEAYERILNNVEF